MIILIGCNFTSKIGEFSTIKNEVYYGYRQLLLGRDIYYINVIDDTATLNVYSPRGGVVYNWKSDTLQRQNNKLFWSSNTLLLLKERHLNLYSIQENDTTDLQVGLSVADTNAMKKWHEYRNAVLYDKIYWEYSNSINKNDTTSSYMDIKNKYKLLGRKIYTLDHKAFRIEVNEFKDKYLEKH